jgi:hypothetical protein
MTFENNTSAAMAYAIRKLLAKGADVPVGRHDLSGQTVTITIDEGHVERHPGTNGDGTDEYVPTIKISVLAALALAVKASGEDVLTVVEHALKVSEQIDQSQKEVVEMIEPIQEALKTVDKKLSTVKATRKSRTTCEINGVSSKGQLPRPTLVG